MSMVKSALIALLLILATVAVYWQVGSHDFLIYDDDVYVTNNPHLTTGFTLENIIWAFTAVVAQNWQPLTWLSHMADCQLYRLRPRGHHLTSRFLHTANTLLLFLLLG